jgi:glycosyltransferase involved in cell wall biosynthesis
LKILQVNASYKPAYTYGGPTMSVSKLSEQMVKAGMILEVYATTANGNSELQVKPNERVLVDGVPATYFKRITKDHSHFSPALLRKLWNEVKKFDIVHIHAWWNLVSVLSCWVAVLRKVPVVISPRGTLSAYSFTNKNSLPKKIIHILLGKRLLKRSTIHVTSEREREGIEALIDPKRIINIPNFILLPEIVSTDNREPGEILKLLFFSRIEEKKGLDILLNALKGVTIPYQLTIAGDGETSYIDKLKSIAASNNVSKHINWIGFQGANKFDILEKHDLMILPSHDENFGNVVIESLSVGTAVLVTKYVGLADYVSENNLGWVCDLDENAISNYINGLARENDKLQTIRKQAPGQVRKNFSDESLREKYIDMYHQIINNG